MSTSNKKPIRRGRQKKELLDDEDLQRQQQLQKAIQEGKVKPQSTDIFDTAKLDKNYFVRQENKSYNHEPQIFNFDQQAQSRQQAAIAKQQKEAQVQKTAQKKPIVNKRRDQRRKQKNQNIFDSDEEQHSEKQQQLPIKYKNEQQTITKQKQSVEISQDSNVDKNKIKQSLMIRRLSSKDKEQLKQQKETKKQQSQEENDQISDQQQENQNQQQQQQDQFDNVIKQQEERSEGDQKNYILHKQIAKLPKQDVKPFYYQTLEPNHVAYAYFKRFSSGLSEVYQLCGEDHRPLLFCENQRGCIGANYYISITKQMDKNNHSYLGKLRGNAAGSTYYLYDDGIQPKNQMNRSEWRVSMAAIQYENNFMGMNGPRKIKVTTPSAKLLEDADVFKLSQQESLLSFQPPIITQFRNKTPKWNQKLKSYALNFGGRVKRASIKNFILIDNAFDIDDEDDADNVIVFGKIDETTFSLQYRHPLSLFQAFGIVMSEFDFKLSCE